MLLIATATSAVVSVKTTGIHRSVQNTLAQTCLQVNWTEEQKLLGSDTSAGDNFSYSLYLDGDTALIGAYGDDDKGVDSGAAYIFVRVGDTWMQQTKLLASDGASTDNFGFGVTLDGDTALVGAPYKNGWRGAVYVFIRDGTTWTEQAKLVASDPGVGDAFGMFLSLDGDTALIASTGYGDLVGSVYVFTRTGSVWSQQAKILASDGIAYDYFGQNVCVDGDTALIGAPGHDEAADYGGAAYVFMRSGSTWTETQELLASDAENADNFGLSVSLEGDTALIAAPADDPMGYHSGSIYVFTRDDDTWTEQQKFFPTDSEPGDLFGWWSISLSGDKALAGSMRDDDFGTSSGSAYIFTRGETNWTQETKLLPSDGAEQDYFGYAVSLSGDTALVGAYLDDDNGLNCGSAYIFKRMTGNEPTADFSWTPQDPSPGQQITFDASASHDPDGTIIFYEWDWNNDGVYEETVSSPTIIHSWATVGSYPVTLQVTDNDYETNTKTKTVNVGINLEIDIKGGLGVNAVITNQGASAVTDVTWQIEVHGGILGRINKTIDGTVDIAAGESETVGTGMLLGLGPLTIMVHIASQEQTASGTQLIIFSLVI
jgi:hypothetical protein